MVATLLAACSSDGGAGDAETGGGEGSPAQAPGGTASLKIMEFNIEYGGGLVDFSKVPEAIQASGADVVMVEEAFGKIPKIADELGWDYVDNAHQLVSRLPVFPSAEDPHIAYVELAPGKMAAVANVHLSSTGYGPNMIERKGYNRKQTVANESRRLKEMTPIVESAEAVAAAGVPTFIVGDLNSPSHRDYTDAMVGSRPQVDFAVPWPVTMLVEDAGFVDSYRAIHPDPVANPGLTWPAWRPKVKGWNPEKGFSLEDRIDYIFSAGPAEATDSFIMGEVGGPDVDRSVEPWPTDHRALVSTFEIPLDRVGPAPNLVAFPSQIADIGDPLTVSYSGEGAARVVAAPAEGADGPTAGSDVTGASGTAEIDTSELEPMPYEIQLHDANGTVLAAAPIWFQEAGAGPTVATEKPSYRVGEPIVVTWYGAPGSRWDWVGTFERNDGAGAYINYEYTKATVAGEATIDASSPGPWPLEPGRYSVYLLPDDSYKIVATNEFVVKG